MCSGTPFITITSANAEITFALDQLRSTDRELLEFVYWERLTYREIAKIIGVSENAVGIRINRAKLVLKALLSSEQGDSSSPSIFGREFES